MAADSESGADRDPRTYAIIGAALDVHRELGCGFLEGVYHEAMVIELSERGVPYRREAELPVLYKGKALSASYRPDFICYGSVVVELKALARLDGVEEAQAINYMKAGGFSVALLFNFGAKSLEHRRLVLTRVEQPR
jgi:GxxExxY protein